MNITLTSLEALILKATNENLPCPDPAALEAFCAVMRDSTEGPQLAAQALAARVHASNAREALLALSMLDRCMRRGDANFQAEVGKFRFLNEMIKLVSPKYFADRTAPEVRNRVLQLFHAWSIEYPKEPKFKVAYDMLRNQGVIRETPPPLPPEDEAPRPPAKSAIFEDDEKSKLLQKLLQSKKPEDLQHANRLIKTMVKEEERRSEANSRRAAETEGALASAYLLRDMLVHADQFSPDELQLLHDVHACCLRQRPVLQRLAASGGQGDNLDDILQASDLLDEVSESYNSFMSGHKEKTKVTEGTRDQPNGDSLLELAAGDGGGRPQPPSADRNAMDELGDIFAADCRVNTIAQPLTPVTLTSQDDTDLLSDGKLDRAEGWNELDSLGEQLLRQSLPDNARRVDGFNSKISKKIPMNALEKSSPKHETSYLNNSLLDFDFLTKKPEGQIGKPARDLEAYEFAKGKAQPVTKANQLDSPLVKLDDTDTDTDKPKRSMSAYLIWLNSAREQIKAENPGLRDSEIAKRGGQIWRGLKDKSVWEQKAAEAKEQYYKNKIKGKREVSKRNQLRSPLVQLDDTDTEDLDETSKHSMSAYLMWLNSAREQIKAENPGLCDSEIAKIGEKNWWGLKDKSIWEQKASEAKEQFYKDVMKCEGTQASQSARSCNSTNGSPIDTMLDITMPADSPARPNNRQKTGGVSSEVSSLLDISVSVASVKPSGVPPLRVWEGAGLTVVLHFCEDRPRPGVSVVVISTTNNSPDAIDDYKFSAVVPKGCKVRLLPPSATCLPPHNVFAPAAVTQVMLIGRPPSRPPVTLKFAITYVCDDDMISERGEAEALPLPD